MLFKQIHLHGIKAGQISLAFRKWKNPRVKKGSLIKTSIGLVEIIDINQIDRKMIRKTHAIQAGYSQLTELIKILNSRAEGNVYKIHVRYNAPDPRITLRNQTTLSERDVEQIKLKLDKFDKYSKKGPWTRLVLRAIDSNPKLRAQDLVEKINFEKDWLKPNVRKLKNMGLTISLEVGYMLSPRGKVVLSML